MGNGNKVEFLVAICALLTSMMAVYMAWDQGRVMRAQQHGAVFPVLQVDGYARNNSEKSAVGIDIRNSGVGPALIESVALVVDGVPAREGFLGFADSLPANYELSWSRITGRALAPNETVNPLNLEWPNGAFSSDDLRRVTSEAALWSLEICYCSVFGRCWVTEGLGQSRAAEVPECTQEEQDIFEDLGNADILAGASAMQAPTPDRLPVPEPSE